MYQAFVSLDRNKSRMVSEEELLGYGMPTRGLTSVFVGRVFQASSIVFFATHILFTFFSFPSGARSPLPQLQLLGSR